MMLTIISIPGKIILNYEIIGINADHPILTVFGKTRFCNCTILDKITFLQLQK
jgi:hypothetical protein